MLDLGLLTEYPLRINFGTKFNFDGPLVTARSSTQIHAGPRSTPGNRLLVGEQEGHQQKKTAHLSAQGIELGTSRL